MRAADKKALSSSTRLSIKLNEARAASPDVVGMLLTRMESNPEDFTFANKQWGPLVRMMQQRAELGDKNVLFMLTDEEVESLWVGTVKAARQSLASWCMKNILKADEDVEAD